jgi:hypothetical protein
MSKNMSIIRREIWTLDEDFELQEDYPSSWDKEKFKNLTSFATRKRYADENLQKLGSGSSRHVYLIDREKVLKLAANQKGLSQNYDEQSISNVGWHDDIVSKVFDSHPDDFWIESELAYKTKPTRFRKLTGFSIEDVGKFLNQYNQERNGRRVQYGKISDELYDEMMNSEFIGDILSVIDNWDIYDLDKISSYGEVNRNGKPQIVLIDYGLTQQTFSSHYVRESNKFPSLYDKMEKVGIDQKMINEIMKPIIDQGDLEMGVTDKQEEPPHRGGYNGFALQPDSISQGGLNSDINESESIDKFSNVTKDIIEKAIRNIKSFDSTKMIDIYKDTDLKNIYNSYMITIRNLENVLSNSNSDVNFYEKILTVQDFLKKTNIVNENLEYSHVTNASPENDNYQISEYEQVIHNEFKDETIHQIANDATAKLGYNSKPIYIGQGDNGFAYDLGDGKVLKITGSEAEAAESLSLKGKDSKHLAKIFNVFTINKEDTQLYAIHQEKIDTTRSNEMKQYINELNILFSKKFNKGISKILMAYYTDPNLYNMAYADNIERSIESISEGARQFYYGIIGVMNEVKEAKLDTVDFFLPSNLGYKNGNLAFFDFGGRYDKSFGKKKPKQLNIGENLQQMEKDYIKTGLFTDLDKDNIISITNGDPYTKTIANIYAWLLQIKPYDRGGERRPNTDFNSYYKKDLVLIYNQLKNYKKNLFPISNFDPANTKEHPIDVYSAIKRRAEILEVFGKIPSTHQRNLKNIFNQEQNIDHYDYYLTNETKEIRSFFKQLNLISDEKKEIILNKVFSSKNNTIEKLIYHIKSTSVLFLNHDKGIDELIDELNSFGDEVSILYSSDSIVAIDVKSSDAMKTFGCGSQWCFAIEYNDENWQTYADGSHVNIVYNFNEESDSKTRMVVILPTGDVYNMYNEDMEDGFDYLSEIGVKKYINAGGINEQGGSSKFMTQNGSRDEDFQDDENSIADFIMERITSYMPKSKEVKVKKKCRIGGNDDGTSTACNQGDISNLEVTEINDDNAHRRKDNTTNVAEEKNNYLENIIKEELNNLISESRVGLSRGDYENVSDEDLKSYVNKIQNYVDMVDSKKYLSDEDFDDIIYYYLVISYNRDRFQSLVDFGETDRLLNFVRGLLKNRGIINEEIFPEKNNCEILEIPSNVVDFLKKFPNDEQLLRSGGLSNDLLDQWAFGFTENLKQIYPDQLKIIWNDDLENVKYEIKHKGLSDIEFAKSVNLSEPIDVDFDKEGFILQDGHHRYYAAKILNKPLNMKLTIKANPITKLSNMDYDQFHRCIWKQSNNNLNEQLNILKESKDKEEIELNNNCNKYFDFTSLDKYVEFDKPLYSIISKFKTAKLVYMSPQEYLKIIAKNFGLSYEETVNSSMVNKETVLKYAEMMKSGSKSPIGFYTKNKSSQEGRHRALAAMELGCDKIPVIEFYEFKNFNEKQKYVENIINNIKNKYGDINFESTDKYFKSIGFKGISNLGYNDFERNI